MTFARNSQNPSPYDAALDVIAPRQDDSDACEAQQIAAAYAAGHLAICLDF